MLEERVREIYVLFNAASPEEALRLFHEDAIWGWPRGGPDPGVHAGHAAIAMAAYRWRDSWGDFEMTPAEVIERSSDVFVTCRYRATGIASGAAIESLTAHLWTFRDDKVTRWRIFGDHENARRRFLEG